MSFFSSFHEDLPSCIGCFGFRIEAFKPSGGGKQEEKTAFGLFAGGQETIFGLFGRRLPPNLSGRTRAEGGPARMRGFWATDKGGGRNA
jgi:hypothetical protein